ncbi:efflux RND transporter periplasmic adaptor subunit [Mesobacillus maritimus]|uniref:Efflux RND transporter periplasmic adaptor subunit n=1 Tax=Mesobacillus maritimus TaxID=1643336 RepID=A0ABS7K516_9BACI|nr:efflux RND transporter periplasmic adaptor subunit [Mesobacillus maritimus]MBY0097268.1 efflux RND transporter periplasmic adaptor subunit [Mesobacillus maritimus]
MKKIVIAAGILLVVSVMVGINVVRSIQTDQFEVTTSTLQVKELTETVTVPGALSIAEEQFIFYSPEKGEVSEILVGEGEKVDVGTPLVKYRNDQLAIERKKHSLMIESGYIKINNIEDQEDRLQEKEEELAKQVGEEEAAKQVDPEYDQLTTEKRMANLDVRQLLLQQEFYDKQVEDMEVRSEIKGTVIKVDENVAGPDPTNMNSLLHIADLDSYFVSGVISEYDALKIKAGDNVVITSDTWPERTWKGKVEFISILPQKQTNGLENNSTDFTQYPIKVSINQPESLKPGFQLMMEIETNKREVSVLPTEAIKQDGDKQTVFIIKDGKAVRREVKTGLSEGELIEVVAGLGPDDQVIVNPPQGLKEGAGVTLK